PEAVDPQPSVERPAISSARLERWAGAEHGGDATPLREGEQIATSEREHARLSLGQTRVELSPGTLLVPERLQPDVRMRLERGEVRVEFNPEHPGEEGFVLETASARVEVVGTAFRVRVAADGSTDVDVAHGVVLVSPLPFGTARRLLAGQSLHVESRGRPPLREFAGPEAVDPQPSVERPAISSARVSSAEPSPTPSSRRVAEDAGEAPSAVVGAAPDHRERPARPLDPDARFELARRLTQRGEYAQARHELYAIVRGGRAREQARAWSLVADTREREHDWAGAGEAYRRAADSQPNGVYGRTALFALARLREQRLGDLPGARHAYRAYLEAAGGAPLAAQARLGLCRLGELALCPPGQEPAEAPPR
ncbi:MAG: tetratricopeptide repeat protein, partial [Deltaproteobacteria bacterium]|nr:tetratricopeptide repeat protein [Deltaproteobacteria bacterium]